MQSQPIKINLQEEFQKYLSYWKWILLSIITMLFVCYFYLRYASDVYETSAKIQILDISSSTFEMPNAGVSIFGANKVNLENQIENIKSSRIIGNVVDSLNLTTEVYSEGKIKSNELWNNNLPFHVIWSLEKDSLINKSAYFNIEITKGGYKLNNRKIEYQFDKTNFDYEIPFKLRLKSKTSLQNIEGRKYSISLKNRKKIIQSISKKLKIDYVGNQSNILKIGLTGYSAEKITTIVNTLLVVFNNDGVKDRQFVHQKTVDFVDSRFEYLFNELDSIEKNKANYKRNNEVVNVDSYASVLMQRTYQSKSDLDKANTQLILTKLMLLSINKSEGLEILPPNVGIENPEINNLINGYNQHVFKHNKLVQSGGGESNPMVNESLNQAIQLKNNIKSSIIGYQKVLEINRDEIEKINSDEKSNYGSVPNKEKNIRSIERQQTIKENLYVLLLEKREEALVNLAITNPCIKVVEYSSSSDSPIFPDRKAYSGIALLIGLVIPFILIYINKLYNNKIQTKEDIEEEIKDTLIIGEIPNVINEQKKVVHLDRSILSESFRILASNIKFITPPKKDGNVIFVTSSVKGEGKTFVSTNLAITLSSFGKKVVLVGADLRNPQLHNTLNMKNKSLVGVSNYLNDDKTNLNDIIIHNVEEDIDLDIIASGIIPQNPTLLLSNGRFELLLSELTTRYEYIIVDTTPNVLVTDTSLNIELADVVLYVTRANLTEKRLLRYISDYKKLNTIKSMGIILNNVDQNNRYGYKYNYGYNYGYGSKIDNKDSVSLLKKFKEKLLKF